MKALKIIAGVSGAIGLAVGALLIAVSIGLTTWIGRGDTVALPQVSVQTDDGYVILDEFDLMGETPDRFRWVDDFGRATISVRSDSGEDVFIGIANTSSIGSSLRTGDLDAGTWTVSDFGPQASVDWEVSEGPWSLVVTGPDSEALSMTIEAEVPASPLRGAAGLVGATGVAFAMFGGLLLWIGVRRESPTDPPSNPASVPATA